MDLGVVPFEGSDHIYIHTYIPSPWGMVINGSSQRFMIYVAKKHTGIP